MTHIAEDLAVFFDGFEAECIAGSHTFKGLLQQPQVLQAFEDADLITSSRTLLVPSADVALAGLVEGAVGQTVSVTYLGVTRVFLINTMRRGGDGAMTLLTLGAPQ